MQPVTRHHLYSLAWSALPLLWVARDGMALAHSGLIFMLVCLSPGLLVAGLVKAHSTGSFYGVALLVNMLFYEGILLLRRWKTRRAAVQAAKSGAAEH